MARSHCTEPGMAAGVEMGTGTMGYYTLYCTVHTALRQEQEPDPLSPIVLVPVPFPFPVPLPCSVNEPLERPLFSCQIL